MQNSRRNFVVSGAVLAAALSRGGVVFAQAAKLDPNDAKAKELGYVEVASKADKAKFPNYADGQNCSNCVLYAGKPGATAGVCELFPDKLVPAGAWCGAWETA